MTRLLPNSISARLLAAGLAAGLLASGASATSGETKAEAVTTVAGIPVVGGNDACTWARSVNGFKSVDRSHVILTGPGKQEHLVRFQPIGIADATFANSIGVVSRGAQVCGHGFDKLLIDGERVRILEMWRVAPGRTADAAKDADGSGS